MCLYKTIMNGAQNSINSKLNSIYHASGLSPACRFSPFLFQSSSLKSPDLISLEQKRKNLNCAGLSEINCKEIGLKFFFARFVSRAHNNFAAICQRLQIQFFSLPDLVTKCKFNAFSLQLGMKKSTEASFYDYSADSLIDMMHTLRSSATAAFKVSHQHE